MSQVDFYGSTNKNNNEIRNKNEDVIQSTIGNFGRWQFKISTLLALLKLPIAWIHMSIVFLAPPTQFWCNSSNTSITNASSTIDWLKPNQSLLLHEGLNTGYCQTFEKNTPVPCSNGFIYNTSIFHSSIITEWNLVCDNKRLIDMSQITLMLGVLIGNILFGVIADRRGRKSTLIACIFGQSIFGIIASQIPYYWGFISFRFLAAVANGGTIVISFVMCMEIVGGRWRTIVPILYQIPYGLGNSLMAAMAYLCRDWRHLQLALSLFSSVFILYAWLIPESPRWLLATGQQKKAIDILQSAARTNKLDVSKTQIATDGVVNEPKKNEAGLANLFGSRELKRRTIFLCINWLIAGITFYAFSQYLGKVGGNLYFTAAVSGFVSLPGTLFCVYVVNRYGRRLTIAFAHLLTAVCFLGILTVPMGVYVHDWPRVAFAGIGVLGLSVSMPALYLYTGELFPTTARNAGVGFSVMFSRLGSMVAPLVITLQDISPMLPLIVLTSAAGIETLLILPLPETKGVVLPDTIEDIDAQKNEKNLVRRNNNGTESYISVPLSTKNGNDIQV